MKSTYQMQTRQRQGKQGLVTGKQPLNTAQAPNFKWSSVLLLQNTQLKG